MLIKNFFFSLYFLINNFFFYLFLSLILISYVFLFTTFRKKFVFFTLSVIFFSFWGFLFNIDGIMLIFLVTEFTIILLFLMGYLQLYTNFSFTATAYSMWKIIFFFALLLPLTKSNYFYYYISYYKSTFHIIASDFFILYYILFINSSILVIFLTLIISFFSLFFILLYFNLKSLKNNNKLLAKKIHFLRKQNLIKQTNYSNPLISFQN